MSDKNDKPAPHAPPAKINDPNARFDETDVDSDPIEQFKRWFREAAEAGHTEPEAMTLATADVSGAPSARIVLLKGVGAQGFEFFTNYQGRKGRELTENPRAALVFWWPLVRRQVRIEGRVEHTSVARSDEYYMSRARGSRLGAWASNQSEVVANREELETRVEQITAQYEGREVTRPPYWGGFCLVPLSIEFWQERPSRLHDRLRFRREDMAGHWVLERLAP